MGSSPTSLRPGAADRRANTRPYMAAFRVADINCGNFLTVDLAELAEDLSDAASSDDE